MRIGSHLINVLAAAALLGAAAACSRDAASSGTGLVGGGGIANQASLTVRLASVTTSSGADTVMGGIPSSDFGGPSGFNGPGGIGNFGDGMGHHWHGWWGWNNIRYVDSLVVTVTKLEVLTAIPDSENAADSVADSLEADSAKGHDWSQREWGWIQLPVDSAHLDLIHLPDSAAAGIPVATDTLPAGTYRHVRLFIINPMIYFDTLIVTPAGDSLKAGVGYPVIFPSVDSTGAIFRTDDPFVVPATGDTVSLYFDRDDTVRHIIITGDGKIIVPPVMRFGFGGH